MYEFKVVPAPSKGLKSKGLKTAGERFAHALETAMNELGKEGWDYVRTDTLPAEEREGLMGKTTVFQNMMVFRRPLVEAAEQVEEIEIIAALPKPEPEPEPTEVETLEQTAEMEEDTVVPLSPFVEREETRES